jgi:hypothetical protein
LLAEVTLDLETGEIATAESVRRFAAALNRVS